MCIKEIWRRRWEKWVSWGNMSCGKSEIIGTNDGNYYGDVKLVAGLAWLMWKMVCVSNNCLMIVSRR